MLGAFCKALPAILTLGKISDKVDSFCREKDVDLIFNDWREYENGNTLVVRTALV